jgi:hypothetical protein
MSFPYVAALSWRAVSVQYAATNTFHTGALGMTEDGSTYRLCKAGGTIGSGLAAAINYWRYLTDKTGDCIESALSVAIAVGDTYATISDSTNSRAADYYKDGYLVSPDGTYDCIRHIWKSDAEVSDTYKIHVSAPFTVADAVGNTVQCYPNPWSNVKTPGAYSQGNEHFCCMPPAPITSGKYFWGQVKGPHWCWVALGTWPGVVSQDREVYFHINGGIEMQNHGIATSGISGQRAGYLMFSGNYGDALIYMQIE